MSSLEVLISLLGDPAFGDRLERIVFNALRGPLLPICGLTNTTNRPTRWSASSVSTSGRPTTTTPTSSVSSRTSAVAPPTCIKAGRKFASHLWMGTPDGGVAAVAYAPSRVRTQVRGGRDVTIRQETEYPFGETVRLTIDVDEPAVFPVVLRIPARALAPT